MSNLREDKGFTYGISSYTANYIHGSFFSIATEVNASQTHAAIEEIYYEMARLREEKVNASELELVKNYIYGTFLRNFDGPFSLAERYRSVRDFGLGFDYYLKSLEEIQSIAADEVLETARKYFDPDKMIRLVVGQPG
jgi:predicted Zn-dependent peptidase